MRIQVTQYHIDKGVPEDDRRCPVALAIQDAGLPDVRVGQNRDTIEVYGNMYAGTSPYPGAVADFVRAFEHGEPVEPFEFQLDLEAAGHEIDTGRPS